MRLLIRAFSDEEASSLSHFPFLPATPVSLSRGGEAKVGRDLQEVTSRRLAPVGVLQRRRPQLRVRRRRREVLPRLARARGKMSYHITLVFR